MATYMITLLATFLACVKVSHATVECYECFYTKDPTNGNQGDAACLESVIDKGTINCEGNYCGKTFYEGDIDGSTYTGVFRGCPENDDCETIGETTVKYADSTWKEIEVEGSCSKGDLSNKGSSVAMATFAHVSLVLATMAVRNM